MLRFLAFVARLNPLTVGLTLTVTVVAGLQPAAEFWAIKGLVDHLTAPFTWIAALCITVLAGDMLRGLLPYLTERLRQNTELAVEARLLERAARAPLTDLEGSEFFNVLTRAREGLKRDVSPLIGGVLGLIRTVSVLASVTAALATAHWGAALVVALSAGPFWLAEQQVSRRITFIWRGQTEERRRAKYLSDLLTQRQAALEIRLLDLAPELIHRWRENVYGPLRERLGIVAAAGRAQRVSGAVGAIAYGGAVVVLAVTAAAGRLSLGGLAAAVKVAQDFQGALHELVWTVGRLWRSGAFTEDVWRFLDMRPGEPVRPAMTTTNAAAILDGVSFTYPGADHPALRGVSFTVAPGELIAVVGENGAGKSTLVKLLLGLYHPTEGTLRLAEGTTSAPVFQDFVRYAMTAGENIGLGSVTHLHDRARVEAAAARADASELIEALPYGYDTLLSKEWEEGQELSGGQWQKLAIARGYMRDASLLILDEPTAALDPLAELEVFGRFKGLVAGKTGFLISHRLGAARLADRILVLKDGRLAEVGSHDELMALDGEYAALFRTQAGWYR
ncbi:MAG TPA: ABC transporter ATP-binding protein [Symbiobacteriaceae bacterium]|nr:ABC transporter ATP-binding protein [Symbiobacteriaceae bacterium]